MVNAYWESLCFSLPAVPDGCGRWRRLIDTFQGAPSDFLEQEAETQHPTTCTVQSRSIVLMTTGRCAIGPQKATP
jgi:isoamylase